MQHRARLLVLALGTLAACGTPKTASTPSSETPAAAATPTADPSEDAAACPATTLPDTPVGRRTAAFLDVVNAGDPAKIEALVTEQLTPEFQQIVPMEMHVELMQGFHQETGGVVVCRVDYGTETEAIVLLGSKRDDRLHALTVTVEAAAPQRLSNLSIGPASREALEHPPQPLDAAARSELVEGIAAALDDYVFAEVVTTMKEHLRAQRDAGAYDALTHPLPLARRLTKDLREVSRDKHLAIHYSAQPLPPEAGGGGDQPPTPEQLEQQRAESARDGFGIARVEVLEGNVGYVDIRLFHPVAVAKEAITEAMTTLADTDALVVDLRRNGGGDPATVAWATSYLFGKKKVHLNDLYYRRDDQTEEYWTDPAAPGKRFGQKKPVYVLTSGYTFSGGEEFAYNLRALKRATLVGETTGGGAHPVDGVRVSDHVLAIVPVGRAINPITKENWEGTGVEPHVAVPASEALDEALRLIAAKKAKTR